MANPFKRFSNEKPPPPIGVDVIGNDDGTFEAIITCKHCGGDKKVLMERHTQAIVKNLAIEFYKEHICKENTAVQ